jgi:hypothetical protein
MWVSISHSIFTLPNTNHRELLVSSPAWGFWAWVQNNWVTVVLFVWNITGLIVVYATMGTGVITDSAALLCVSSIVWNAGIHSLWSYLSKRTGCVLLPDQIERILVSGTSETGVSVHPQSLEHWVQFMRVNEVSFSAPMLMVCWMSSSMKDQNDASTLQYVFGFVASGLSLLIPLDALGMASQVSFFFCFFCKP